MLPLNFDVQVLIPGSTNFIDTSTGLNKHGNQRLAQKIDEYATSFTLHGVSRIYAGNTVEKILWSIIVLTTVACSIVVLSNYVKKHLRHDIIQAFTSETTNRAYYPQVTFCLDNLRYKLGRLHCGVDYTEIANHTDCEQDELECSVPQRKVKGRWSNGLFNVLYVNNGNKRYYGRFNLANHLYGHENDTKGICTTWHFNKSFYQILSSAYYSTFSIEFEVAADLVDQETKEITVIINEQNIASIYQRAQLHIVPEFSYHLELSKTVTYRKEKPFPSKCSNRSNIDIFPGVYNRETCLLINNDLNVFKKYGITRDITRRFLPNNIRRKYSKNWQHDLYGFRNAFRKFFANVNLGNPNCPLPCHEVTYGFSVITKPTTMHLQPYEYHPERVDIDDAAGKQCFNIKTSNESKRFFNYELHLHFRNPHTFTKIEEKELYPRDQMLGEVGGFLGLMIGASCISLIELIAFLSLAALKRYRK